MPASLLATAIHVLPHSAVQHLKTAILEIGQGTAKRAVIFTDSVSSNSGHAEPVGPIYAVIVSSRLRVLMLAERCAEQPSFLRTELSFDSDRIAAFLSTLHPEGIEQTAQSTQMQQALLLLQKPLAASAPRYEPIIVPLFSALSQTAQAVQSASLPLPVPHPLPASAKSEALWLQVTQQIRQHLDQNLDLPVLLQTAVEQGRACFGVDRLFIYQFSTTGNPDPSPTSNAIQAKGAQANGVQAKGAIAHESCAHAVPSLLTMSTADLAAGWSATDTPVVSQTVNCAADLLSGPWEQLYRGHVRAQLTVPIQVQGKTWGLMIMHQLQSHQWSPFQIEGLIQIADHLGIAIQQTYLHQQVQHQKQVLEAQVNQRTQELQTVLVATQSAHRVKSDFLATMSHELRTPLTCVIGMSATLLRWSLGPLTDKQRSYLQTIHDSGEHLLELINDILDFSQVESGKATLSISEFSLSLLSQQCLQMLREKAAQHEVILKANLKIPTNRDRFFADPRRVKQILFNLLSNAIKFTPAGGKVTLRVWVESNTAVFQVEDTGIGIPPSQQPLLFQKFQQLDTSYQRTYEGTGLGLALTKQFVDMHRGWIDVHSVEGQGSIFTVELPDQVLQDQARQETALMPQSQAVNNRIVLLEDDDESASIICDMLTAAGFHVVWIVDDSAAQDHVRFMHPALAIVSMDLQTGQGGSLIRQFRQIGYSPALKIMALMNQASAKAQQKAQASGADAFLVKPIDPEHLLHKIEALFAVSSS